MEPRFLIQNFYSTIFHPIFNITIICPAFNTSLFGKYHNFDILQILHPLMCSCFFPRSPLRLPTTLRTTRTRPSAAGRSGKVTVGTDHRNMKTYISVPADEEVHVWCETFDLAKGDTLRVGGKELSILIYQHRGK